ncbi:MAG: hypothetical protein ABIJ97_08230 [Bacteroidota bacterium]
MEYNKDKNIKLIKDSFELSNSKTPEFIWENIDKQLYVDRVWMSLKIKLDNIQTLKIRIRFFLYSSCIILFVVVFVGSYFLMKQQHHLDQFVFENATLKTIIFNKNKLNDSTYNRTTYSEKEMFENKTMAKNSALTINESRIYTDVIETSSNKINDSMHQIQIPMNDSNQFNGEMLVIEKKKSGEPLYYINPKEIQIVDINNCSQINDICLPGYYADTSRLFTNYYFMKNEIGLIYALNSTLLINNDYMENNREGSSVSIDPTYASSYGLIYNYKFSMSNSLSLEFFFISNQNQNAYLYSGGKYYKKTIELDYSKAIILYQKNICFNSMKPYSYYFVKAGGYFSILTKNNIYYVRNDEKIDIPNSMLSKNDYGIKVCIGRELEINNFIIGSGLQSDYGIKNIFKGDENTPSYFNCTNNFSYGLFLSIKLKY